MNKQETIVVATIRPWNIAAYKRWRTPPGFRKVLITKKEELTPLRLATLNPRYIFFPHWSWIIPGEVYEKFECVVFHMTDLPFGRGGSPLQNLLVRGIYRTKVSALRVADGVDTGDVYLKRPLDLSTGSAEHLYKKASAVSFGMMTDILKRKPKPKPQTSQPTVFPRRTPGESEIPEGLSPQQLYDFVRMLDAPGYPHAFVRLGEARVELRNIRLKDGELEADATIRTNP